MGHYIYLEEQEITYLCGTCRSFGLSVKPEAFHIEAVSRESRDAALDSVLKRVADRHGLLGKKVTLVLGQALSFQRMVLPRGSRSVVQRMAVNQLIMEEGFHREPAAAVDFRYSRKEGRVCASLFYMEESRLTEYKNAVAAVGMVCSRVVAVPDCMALAAQKLWKEHSLLVVEAEEERLGIYIVSRGHCLAFKNTSLKAPHFYRLKGERLLYEEIAEQAEQLIQTTIAEGNESGDTRPECAVLLGSCLPSPKKGADCLESLLKLPCFFRTMGKERNGAGSSGGGIAVPFGLLAVCMADRTGRRGRPSNIKGRECSGEGAFFHGIYRVLSRGWMAFLLVNAAVALGLGIWLGVLEWEAEGELSNLRLSLMEPEYRTLYQEAKDMEAVLEKMISREAAREAVKGKATAGNLLGIDAFRAFTDSMKPDMEVESMVFQGSNETLSLVISMSSREQIPLYVQQVKETGLFPYVSHSLWEQKEEEGKPERYFVVINASLTKGGTDEAE